MQNSPQIIAILVAAGDSTRLGAQKPKPYLAFGRQTVLEQSLSVLMQHPAIARVLLVANPAHQALYQPIVESHGIAVVQGGKTRQESVFRGLDALADDPPDWVLIHDTARPYLSVELIDRVVAGLAEHSAVIPAITVKDTIKRVDGQHVVETPRRDALRAVQTPQGFHYTALLAAHMAALDANASDDAGVMELVGASVWVVEGDEANQKITTPSDWRTMQPRGEMRVGQGFDVHRLIRDAARPLMIGGIGIESDWALEGHSDADVALHALIDAMLGAIGAGDIGEHFPPSDDRWKNADSAQFVAEAVRLLEQSAARVINADITIIAEQPKIGPHRAAMRHRVAELLDISLDRVNIKATTTEKLGFTGRGEGIAAQAVVCVEMLL